MSYQTRIHAPGADTVRSVSVEPVAAVVISRAHCGRHHIDNAIAPILTYHGIRRGEPNAPPIIGDGTVVSAAGLLAVLSEAGFRQHMSWIDPRVLAVGTDGFIWHSPERLSWMYWKIGGNPTRLKVWWPHLVFHVNQATGLRVYAVATKSRPTTGDRLYKAPIGNVYDNASLCWGNIQEPERVLSSIPEYESAIYDTYFTHANARVLADAAKAPADDFRRQDLFRYWKARSASKARPIPVDHLLGANKTVGDLL